MSRILVVEDDELLREGIVFALEREGQIVSCAGSIEEFRAKLQKAFDLVILDVSLPDGDSRESLPAIRERNQVPVIFLTARNTEQDMIAGFDAGADDYITKPFSVPVLMRRVNAVMKRSGEQNRNFYESGSLIYDFAGKQLTIGEKKILLTPTEIKLLELFLSNRNIVLTKEKILDKVWDIDGNFVEDKALSVNIRRMREKIEADPKKPAWIKTVFGIGYKWEDI